MSVIDSESTTEKSQLDGLKSQIKLSQDSLKMSFFLTFVSIVAILIFLGYVWQKDTFDLARSYLPAVTLLSFVSILFSTMYRGTSYFTQVHFPDIQNEGTAKRWKYARTIFSIFAYAFLLGALTLLYFGITA
jgi:hypothetical protein